MEGVFRRGNGYGWFERSLAPRAGVSPVHAAIVTDLRAAEHKRGIWKRGSPQTGAPGGLRGGGGGVRGGKVTACNALNYIIVKP